MTEFDRNDRREEIFSKAVRAGKRTYFFDVKTTRANDHYLTITESKKRFGEDGEKPYYEKHKIFLYKEDFDKFMEGRQVANRLLLYAIHREVNPRHHLHPMPATVFQILIMMI